MRILVGICGSIAAYRSPELIRELMARGHDLKIVITNSARRFVTETTLETFSKQKILSNDPFGNDHLGTDHIALARWADKILIYGATAQSIARYAHGFGDDFLSLQILATQASVLLAPAMNPEMWNNPAIQNNVDLLRKRNFYFIGPISGTVACGETGIGHVADVDEIANFVDYSLPIPAEQFLKGKKVLISAGPMISPLDPARHLTNKSSGIMGLELARAARYFGAEVRLLLGPVRADLEKAFSSFQAIRFKHRDTYEKHLGEMFASCDVFFSVAAVLDFEFKSNRNKLERSSFSDQRLEIPILPTPDFVKEMGLIKQPHQHIIAFAAETGSDKQILERAQKKLVAKNSDALILNPIREGSAFETVTNQMWLLRPNAPSLSLGYGTKSDLAKMIFIELFSAQHSPSFSSMKEYSESLLQLKPVKNIDNTL